GIPKRTCAVVVNSQTTQSPSEYRISTPQATPYGRTTRSRGSNPRSSGPTKFCVPSLPLIVMNQGSAKNRRTIRNIAEPPHNCGGAVSPAMLLQLCSVTLGSPQNVPASG